MTLNSVTGTAGVEVINGLAHEVVGVLNDAMAGAVVGWDKDFGAILWEKVRKLLKIPQFGAGETVDGLPIVADGEEVRFRAKITQR